MITKPEGYEQAQAIAGERQEFPAGGHVLKIMGAKETLSSTKKPMLELSLDVAEGEYKDFFMKSYKADTRAEKKWGCKYYQMLTPESAGFFKGLVQDIEASNNFTWDFDETRLKGKLIGMLFRREEYQRTKGGTGFVTKPFQPRAVSVIREGKFTIPEDKLLNKSSAGYNDLNFEPDYGPLDDEHMPF